MVFLQLILYARFCPLRKRIEASVLEYGLTVVGGFINEPVVCNDTFKCILFECEMNHITDSGQLGMYEICYLFGHCVDGFRTWNVMLHISDTYTCDVMLRVL